MRYEIALEETLGVGSKKLINCDETKINNQKIQLKTEKQADNRFYKIYLKECCEGFLIL